jgi:prepilin-type N-terminal cleavage/methylation domain-containing protein
MRKGFTLIEMLVVVAIIVALLAIIGFAGPALTKGSKVNAYKGTVKNMGTALSVVLQNTGTAPAAADATNAMLPYLSGKLSNPFDATGSVALAAGTGGNATTAATSGYTDPVSHKDATVAYTSGTISVDGVSVPWFRLDYQVAGETGSYVSSNSITGTPSVVTP